MIRCGPNDLRALVVEDERRLRTVLLDMIPELGIEVIGAASAEEAMTIMQADPREIVLLDLQLPMMSGMEFFEQVRRRWPRTQVVILTAFGQINDAQQAIRLDVVDFLRKPFHLRDIELAFDRARRRCTSSNDHDDNRDDLVPANQQNAMTLAEAEYRQIAAALHRHAGNRTAAAAELGISRRTLHYRLTEYKERGWRVE